MARPSLDQNPKFKLLVRRLGIPRPYVLGLLETMWRVAWENGEPIIGTPDEIEAAAEWPGEPGKFHAALVSGRLLDDMDDGRWAIHDFWDHAPEYVQKRRKRELERQQRGTALADNGGQRRPKSAVRRKTAPKSRTPAPALAPAPVVPPSAASPPIPPLLEGRSTTAQRDASGNLVDGDAFPLEDLDPTAPRPVPLEALRRQMNGETPGDGCRAAPGSVEDLGPDVCVACHHKWGLHGDTGQRGCMAIGCSCGALVFPQAAVQWAEHQAVGPRAAEDQCASGDLAMVRGAAR